MKSVIKKSDKQAAFTIVELLTVMSIIVILIGLLVPALSKVRIFSREVKQRAQFHSMDSAIELYNTEFDGYPPSGDIDPAGVAYCGAMKLCEAMMGQDLMGFHPDSIFRADGTDGAGTPFDFYTQETESARVGTYLPLESANAFKVSQIFGESIAPFNVNDNYVLCDIYSRTTRSGIKTGMPILYYKANISKNSHSLATLNNNIYDYRDNDELVKLGMSTEEKPPAGPSHPLASTGLTRYEVGGSPEPSDPRIFYEHTSSEKIKLSSGLSRPYRSDSYILLSAGNDGEYGTRDDIYNFDKSLIDFVDFEIKNP
ncbi:MAG: type II secretion system protein [Sedimentisphaerales bacterium]|nr:type II secretion system protein [Sedimentisphaerales bacterium]